MSFLKTEYFNTAVLRKLFDVFLKNLIFSNLFTKVRNITLKNILNLNF